MICSSIGSQSLLSIKPQLDFRVSTCILVAKKLSIMIIDVAMSLYSITDNYVCVYVCVCVCVHVCGCMYRYAVCMRRYSCMCASWWLPSNQSFYRQFGGYVKGVGH